VVARIGGEEFCIYAPNTDQDGGRVLAEKIREAIESLDIIVNSTKIHITASVGVAYNLPHHETMASIQRDADTAMYEAKRQGRNRVSCIWQSASSSGTTENTG
jgi:diguanylate cyclase (GGDEF)-like protein